MTITAERLKRLRKSKGVTQKAVADFLGIKENAYQQNEYGKRIPNHKNLLKLTDYYGVSLDYITGLSDTPNNEPPKGVKVPVLGRIPAGIPIEAIEDILDYEEIPADWCRGGKEYFALKLKGDSMLPEYVNGEIVIFRKSTTCDSGNDCAIMINGEDATFKKVIKDFEGITLVPYNEAYSSVFYTNKEAITLPVCILGVAVESRRKRG